MKLLFILPLLMFPVGVFGYVVFCYFTAPVEMMTWKDKLAYSTKRMFTLFVQMLVAALVALVNGISHLADFIGSPEVLNAINNNLSLSVASIVIVVLLLVTTLARLRNKSGV